MGFCGVVTLSLHLIEKSNNHHIWSSKFFFYNQQICFLSSACQIDSLWTLCPTEWAEVKCLLQRRSTYSCAMNQLGWGEIFLCTDGDKIIGGKKVNHLCCGSSSVALQADFRDRKSICLSQLCCFSAKCNIVCIDVIWNLLTFWSDASLNFTKG